MHMYGSLYVYVVYIVSECIVLLQLVMLGRSSLETITLTSSVLNQQS